MKKMVCRFVVKADQKRNGTYAWWIQDTRVTDCGTIDAGPAMEIFPDRAVAVQFREKAAAEAVCYLLNDAWRKWAPHLQHQDS